jgi:putative colanic acid biosynthesis UDP-glucose lipid carrier transferase
LNGREIEVWKFRTTRVLSNDNNFTEVKRKDPQIIRVGNFLRLSSLDELPQLFNVLQGNMSLIGPRPYSIIINERYRSLISRHMLPQEVKPGITGWAQINGWKSEINTPEDIEQKIKYDLWYFKNWSLWLDLKIIFFTALNSFLPRKRS